jgi:hypothetical protein
MARYRRLVVAFLLVIVLGDAEHVRKLRVLTEGGR